MKATKAKRTVTKRYTMTRRDLVTKMLELASRIDDVESKPFNEAADALSDVSDDLVSLADDAEEEQA
jgi:hypothetical protein